MKKLFLVFIMISTVALLNRSQAVAECRIEWAGDLSGSIATQETSRSLQAANQLSHELLGGEGFIEQCSDAGGGCYFYRPGYEVRVYLSGSYSKACLYASPGCNYQKFGSWDVLCDNTTTTSATTSVLPTVVEMSSFTATSTESSIILRWETESEPNNAGFYLYRAEYENGTYKKITSTMILTKGSTTQGASYEFIDTDVQKLKTYYYELEDLDLQGKSSTHEPVHATVGVTETTTIPAGTTTTTAPASQCAVETIYGAHSVETELLREYRDTVLSRSETGRQIIRKYYELSPAVSEYLRKNEAARAHARNVLDSLMPAIREKLVK